MYDVPFLFDSVSHTIGSADPLDPSPALLSYSECSITLLPHVRAGLPYGADYGSPLVIR
jgi:hypothetical protein